MPACAACGTANPDRARFCLECGTRLRDPTQAVADDESRRTVTILFSDVVGPTALAESLDPEGVHAVLSAYFTRMRVVIERHGGTVEKFIGDAIMAVFGLPVLHEDDALRAVRAAVEMRSELADLNVRLRSERGVEIASRTGVHTGEVLAGDASAGQAFVAGDAVNTAARLEQAAPPGEILVGPVTWRLVRDVVDGEPLAPLELRGKAQPIAPVRVRSIRTATSEDAGAVDALGPVPFVGRRRELADLAKAVDRASAAPYRVVVLGPPGVGKSRLVAELLRSVGDRAVVVRGRCLSYGEGIAYWPLREVIDQAASIGPDATALDATDRIEAALAGAPEAGAIASRLATAVGIGTASATSDEIAWAARRFLEHIARGAPLVFLLEDAHWAQPPLLDLVDHVVERSTAGVLVLVTARAELLDARPAWADDERGTVVRIEGLPADAGDALIDAVPGGSSIPPALRSRILETADGNPLFVEEIVRMLVEEGVPAAGAAADSLDVPPTIHALMAARVDRLPRQERSVAQHGSVPGRVFEADGLVALSPDAPRAELLDGVLNLIRREVLARDAPEVGAGEAFRFRHVLLRDAAYAGLRKAERAELHERFANWIVSAAGDRRSAFEEIVGFHLAEAYRYQEELGRRGDAHESLGRRAGEHLLIAAGRARQRGDSVAAVRLFGQAERLPHAEDAAFASRLLEDGLSREERGDFAGARSRAESALALAATVGAHGVVARARLLGLDLSIVEGTREPGDDESARVVAAALRDAEAAADDEALADAWHVRGNHLWNRGDVAGSDEALRRALEFAGRTDDHRFELEIELNRLIGTFASQPTSEVIPVATSLIARAHDFPSTRGQALGILGASIAMLGRFEEGLAAAVEGVRVLEDLGQIEAMVNARTFVAWVHRLQNDYLAAEAELRRAMDEVATIGDLNFLSFVSSRLAENLVAQGRLAEAARHLTVAERHPIAATASRIAGVRARLAAAERSGHDVDALVDRLLAMVEPWPWINVKAEAYMDAAQALAAAGQVERALVFAAEAARLCREKENLAFERQVEALAARLRDGDGVGYRTQSASPGSV